MAFALPPASAEDVIRAALKDNALIAEVARHLQRALELLAPRLAARTPRIRHALAAAASVLYHACALRGCVPRTPGDEYAGVAAISSGRRPAAAGVVRRVLAAALSALPDVVAAPHVGAPWRTVCAALDRLHLAAFYANGAYRTPAQRVAAVRYARVARRRDAQLPAIAYRALAALLAAHTALVAYRALRAIAMRVAAARAGCVALPPYKLIWYACARPERLRAMADAGAAHIGTRSSPRSCTLCLEAMTAPTLTPCGHVFCWSCVVPWCTTKEMCPLCRRPAPARKLLCLHQF